MDAMSVVNMVRLSMLADVIMVFGEILNLNPAWSFS